MGGSNSIRGWYDSDLGVSQSFGEITVEYRFPLISIFQGEVFVDAGTDFGPRAMSRANRASCWTRTAPACHWNRRDCVHTGRAASSGSGQQGFQWRLALQSRSRLEVLVTNWPQDYSGA